MEELVHQLQWKKLSWSMDEVVDQLQLKNVVRPTTMEEVVHQL